MQNPDLYDTNRRKYLENELESLTKERGKEIEEAIKRIQPIIDKKKSIFESVKVQHEAQIKTRGESFFENRYFQLMEEIENDKREKLKVIQGIREKYMLKRLAVEEELSELGDE